VGFTFWFLGEIVSDDNDYFKLFLALALPAIFVLWVLSGIVFMLSLMMSYDQFVLTCHKLRRARMGWLKECARRSAACFKKSLDRSRW
jgi:hypothetical protein